MRDTIANFIRASIRESRDQSIAGALRQSVASMIKDKGNFQNKLDKLSKGMGQINSKLRMEEVKEEQPKIASPKYNEEGEMSAFMELQCQDEDKPLSSGFV